MTCSRTPGSPSGPDNPTTLIVSACLLGEHCRYDGATRENLSVVQLSGSLRTVPLCPEVEAGFGAPRPPIHIDGEGGGEVLDGSAKVVERESGRDVTAPILAACRALSSRVALLDPARTLVIFKERSPSCGVHRTHTRDGLAEAPGVFAALLKRMGFTLLSEEDL